MKVGFSLSPGGLLLPYHVGVLDGLAHKGMLDQSTPLAGASAGAIAVACHGCAMDGSTVVDATTELAAQCSSEGSQALVEGLRNQMCTRIGTEEMIAIQTRLAPAGIAYHQVFPQIRPVIQTEFQDADDLTQAVCFSSTFPFFSSPFPVALDTRGSFPRLVLDGFFSVPRDRLGCPNLDLMLSGQKDSTINEEEGIVQTPVSASVDRTVCITPFPKDAFGLTGVDEKDCISPGIDLDNPEERIKELLYLATTPLESGGSEYAKLYEEGFLDAENWVAQDKHHLMSLEDTSRMASLN